MARAVLAHSTLREQEPLKVLDLVDSECAALCWKTGPNGPSPFCRLPVEKNGVFVGQIQELILRGPFLFRWFSEIGDHHLIPLQGIWGMFTVYRR